MGTNKKRFGKCEICGGSKNIMLHFGKKCCSMCSMMRGMAKNNPAIVIAALKEFGNMPEASGINAEAAITEGMNKLKEDAANYIETVKEYSKSLAEKNKEVADLVAERDGLVEKINLLEAQIYSKPAANTANIINVITPDLHILGEKIAEVLLTRIARAA